jgi:zinc protease
MNLREQHGFSYGAYSSFAYLRTGGWFISGAGVRTDVTAPAVKETLKEIARIAESPVTQEEMALAKDGIIGALPAEFETSSDTVGMLANLYIYDLGVGYYRDFPTKILAVTEAQVQEVAKKYLMPEKMVVIAVGDRKVIEPGLKQLGFGKIELRDVEGKPSGK